MGWCGLAVECATTMHKALGSTLRTTKIRKATRTGFRKTPVQTTVQHPAELQGPDSFRQTGRSQRLKCLSICFIVYFSYFYCLGTFILLVNLVIECAEDQLPGLYIHFLNCSLIHELSVTAGKGLMLRTSMAALSKNEETER